MEAFARGFVTNERPLQNGNIAELLLAEGFARCVDWSIALVTGGSEKLRAAERAAKEKKIRLWKNYTPSGSQASPIPSKIFVSLILVHHLMTILSLIVERQGQTIFWKGGRDCQR